MEKSRHISVNSIDIEKAMVLFRMIINEIAFNKKVRGVLEHDPEQDKSTIEVFNNP